MADTNQNPVTASTSAPSGAPSSLSPESAAPGTAPEGVAQIQALFYGVGPSAIAIIVLAAWKLARSTNKHDVKLWAISLILGVITVVTRAELAWLFVLAGFLGIAVYAPPWRARGPG